MGWLLERPDASTVPSLGGLMFVGRAKFHPLAVRFKHLVKIVQGACVMQQNGVGDGRYKHVLSVLRLVRHCPRSERF